MWVFNIFYRDTVESNKCLWIYLLISCWRTSASVGSAYPNPDWSNKCTQLWTSVSLISWNNIVFIWNYFVFQLLTVSRNMIDTIATFKWTFFNLKMTKESECKLIFSYFSRIFKNQSELVLIVRGMLLSDWKSPNLKFLRNNQRVREYLILHF